jgi:signal transduction histidine kinase
MLPGDRLAEFFTLLEMATQPRPLLSSREERQLRRQLTQTLTEQGIEYAPKLADTLSKMGISEGLDPLVDLLKHSNILFVLESAYSLSSIQSNSQNIQLAVERASKIVFALKAYVRQEQGGQKVKASITDGIETVLTIYHSQIKQGIEVIKSYQPIPIILCYPDELIQVWSNLIFNAVQAMNYKGRLEIQVSQEEQQICVVISDSGGGIPPEILDKVFSPFFTTKPMGEGSGLGLHIARQIVEKHSGNIAVLNTSDGARFTVYLPILER